MKHLALVILASMCSSFPLLADTSATLSYSMPGDANIVSAVQIEVRAGGDKYYGWTSYSSHSQIAQTQRLGNVDLIGVGAGTYRSIGSGVTIYAEAGAGYLTDDYSNRVLREIVYYSFAPTFGEPPFLPDGGWWDLTSIYEPDPIAPMIRIGALVELTPRISLELSYMHFVTSVYFSTWNPNVGGGPIPGNFDACGCLWEGQGEINLSGAAIGFSYRF